MPLTPETLREAVIEALHTRGLRARLGRRLGQGLPLGVILDRLDPAWVTRLAGIDRGEDPPAENVRRQRALRALRAELEALEAEGRVRRAQVVMGIDGRGHGLRQGVVDAWRLR